MIRIRWTMTASLCLTLGSALALGCTSNEGDETPLPKGKGGNSAKTYGGAPSYGGSGLGGTSTSGGYSAGGSSSGGVTSAGGRSAGGTSGAAGSAAAPPSAGGRDAIDWGGIQDSGGIPGIPSFGGIGGSSTVIRADTGGFGGIIGGISIPTSGGSSGTGCDAPNLVWKTANKASFESYPAPNSPECAQLGGCDYGGEFLACSQKRSRDWVSAHNIAAVFPDLGALKLHDLCLRSGFSSIVVTVYDECVDSDCSGCCSENLGRAEELIELEKSTDDRFGIDDGPVLWADLGPTKGSGCN